MAHHEMMTEFPEYANARLNLHLLLSELYTFRRADFLVLRIVRASLCGASNAISCAWNWPFLLGLRKYAAGLRKYAAGLRNRHHLGCGNVWIAKMEKGGKMNPVRVLMIYVKRRLSSAEW